MALSTGVQGTVVRFDQVRGYGFISPDSGGEDVFLHVNDLLDDKTLVRAGTTVQFDLDSGERGLKASSVRIVGASHSAAPGSLGGGVDGGFSDRALSVTDFTNQVTEALLTVVPPLTGAQILAVRQQFRNVAVQHGWVKE